MVSTFPLASTVNLKNVRLEIRALQPQLVEWRRQIHQKPELGFQEKITAEFISQKLQNWGIEHQVGIAQTGIVAIIKGEKSTPGKVLAIRADMDALPIQELNEVPYCSQRDGIMHACGHDGHTAIALGTAYYLHQHRQELNGTVKIIFQPAEEGPGGAKPMIAAGVLNNPDVDAIIGLHLWNNLPLGTVGVRPGALMAAVELFRCTIFGKGGHGAIPHQTVDSLVVAAQIVSALQTIVSRNINPLDSAVVTVGELHAGTAVNVIADTAKMGGTVRYFNPDLAGFFKERIEKIIAGICQSHGANYDLDYIHLYPPVINDAEIAALVRSVAQEVIEIPIGVFSECQTMGGEDMSFFLQEVPGCYFFLGSANAEKKLDYPHHHPRFDFDETALPMGVEMFVRCVEKFFA
ncbi:M20 family metallopeptidase [Dolichospermum circinale]|uniref:M20 family metallopeptidase n=1 Tax=Dolichospermum circinale TaxID=109265 RepID=UPI0003F61D4D|nr:M20 family metallopeptidase [Dolichospermum circinale]MDB9456461.1 M20 family metallopeptidase [Dolichospermum circinale CS-541/06]MDB9461034.1 M20 family metallopeptidase [Dolichospermum circinale CS-541/04]MDB9476202.1 M20 family metallopeptidase [Dolichospermum circinale CS-537/11]MDB9479374.1 M20 family metallopeptidase [Dolichospermum circinale CS-537/03]MDB9547910.1 M20 family metallopeptidase [Dolichospermum circinale CS-1031]